MYACCFAVGLVPAEIGCVLSAGSRSVLLLERDLEMTTEKTIETVPRPGIGSSLIQSMVMV